MPLVLADRVRDTTTTTGTGTVTLSGTAPTGYQSFAVIGNGNTTYYTINAGSQWEVGIGTYSSTGPTLTRNTVLESSNSNALVDFAAGTKDVFVTYPADKSVNYDENNNVGIGTSSPAQRLDVLSSGDTPAVFRSAGANTYFQFVNSVASAGYIGYSGSALTFWTGPERMRITAAGNVGVGTSAPVNKLESVYNVPVSVPATGTVGGHGFAVGGIGFGIAAGALNNGNGYLQVTQWDGTSANYNLLLQPNGGNVGIGTSTPGAKLEVQGTDGVSSIIVRDSATTNIFDVVPIASNGALVRVFDNTGVSRVQFTAYGASYFNAGNVGIGTTSPATRLTVSDGAITAGASGDVLIGRNSSAFPNPGAGYFRLRTNNTDGSNGGISIDTLAANTLTERMRIDFSGNVSIGTSTSLGLLTVGSGSGASTAFQYLNAGSGGSALIGRVSGNNTWFVGDTFAAFGSGTGLVNFAYGANPILFATNSTERMRITGAGNVGIGTTAPNKLLTLTSPTNDVEVLRINAPGGSGGVQGRADIGFGFFDTVDEASAAVGFEEFGTSSAGGSLLFKTRPDGAALGTRPTERMRIDSAGNVGIGTTSPGARLEVQGGTNTVRITNTDASAFAGVEFRDNAATRGQIWVGGSSYASFGGAGSINYSANSGPHVWYTNYAERMRIDSAGNVGIGTTSPDAKLDILGTSSDQLRLRTAETEEYRIGRNASTGLLDFYGSQSGFTGYTFGGIDGERMRITSAGNVGIGTSSPSGRLHVTEANKIFDTFGNLNVFTSDAATVGAGGAIALGGNNGTGGTSPYPFAKIQGIKEGATNTWNGALLFGTTAGSSAITERMRIDSSGNVGIGTSSPASTLDVGGTIRTGAGGSDPGTGAALYFVGSGAYQTVVAGAAFAVNTGGNNARTERMRIDSAGNVGIGTSSVSAVFGTTVKVYSAGSGGTLEVGGATVNARFYGSEGLGLGGIGTSTNHPFTFISNGTERMRITAAGDVGIGTSSPTRLLSVAGTTNAYMDFSASSFRRYTIGSESRGFILYDDTGSAYRMVVNSSGNVGIGTDSPSERLNVSGNILATGNITAFSDIRLKDNVEQIGGALERVAAIRGVTYTRNDLEDKERRYAGVIAQELEQVLPEAVSQSGDMKAVDYNATIGLLIEAIKELKAEIETLKKG